MLSFKNLHKLSLSCIPASQLQAQSTKLIQKRVDSGMLPSLERACVVYPIPVLRLLHTMNVRFSLLDIAQRILGVTLPNFQ
jgi:hypothetical protein